ncbi:MAG TPA: hypothetical protein VL349_06525 [Terriglobales bacterium]|jgi:hypothetical protein|nr:hypothetical protein [Terriglobales bacterium]
MGDKNSRIMKIAGLSFVGFCAVSVAVDRASLSPVTSQLAGFCGAFVGALIGGRGASRQGRTSGEEAPEPEAAQQDQLATVGAKVEDTHPHDD